MSSLASAQQSWDGFKPASEIQVGSSDFINQAVVMLRTVGGISEEYEKAYTMVNVDKEPEIKNVKKLNYKFNMNEPQKNMRTIQIETCRKQGLKKCPVYEISATSSGFFGQGRYLNMCRHSFHNWLVLAAKANNRDLETLSPPMIIFSKDKDILYNSALVPAAELIKVSYLNFDERLNNELYKYNDHSSPLSRSFTLSDYIQLESPKELVPSMAVAFVTDFNALKKGTRVYMAGYPAQTQFFSDGKGDTPGYELVVSTGTIRATSTKQNAVQVSALSSGGMSGGPILLEDGSAAGVVCSSESPSVDQPETGYTTSIVINRPVLEMFWQGLSY